MLFLSCTFGVRVGSGFVQGLFKVGLRGCLGMVLSLFRIGGLAAGPFTVFIDGWISLFTCGWIEIHLGYL